MKIDLTKFKIYTSIRKDAMVEVNIKNEIVDALYTSVSGMLAHSLTHKLYESEGEVELTNDELSILDALFSRSTCVMIDSWNYWKENN